MNSVAIVEDHLLLAETLSTALGQRGVDATVVPVQEYEALLAALLVAAPGVVLLDLDLGCFGDSTALIAPLSAAGIRVLVVTGVTERLRGAQAVEQGAVGIQPKALGFDALLTAAFAVLAGASVLSATDRATLLTELAQARAEQERASGPYRQLTGREQGTLQALSEGRSVHEIAGDWVLSEATVRTHVRGVLVKLGVASQLAAVAAARRNGWLSPDCATLHR
jgi:DNA-binding NarL/FixJ family response regulator